jgi:hypothetical protein
MVTLRSISYGNCLLKHENHRRDEGDVVDCVDLRKSEKTRGEAAANPSRFMSVYRRAFCPTGTPFAIRDRVIGKNDPSY